MMTWYNLVLSRFHHQVFWVYDVSMMFSHQVMAACGNAKQWTKALEILSLIETGNELDDVSLGSAMDACQNSSQWEVALLLLVDFKGSKLQTTAITQNATISSCGKAKEWTFALALLQDLRLDADVISYNSTISSCEKASEYQPAVWLFDELRVGLEATVVTYSAIISACEKASEWQTALHFLSESTSQRLSNLITFNAAISACEKSAEVNMALALVKQLQSFHLEGDVVTFSASIGACDRASKWQDALGLYFEAGRSHVEIGVVGCTSTINACEKVAQWHQALLVFPLHFDVTRVANASISACEKASRWQVALCLLDEVKFVEFLEPDVVTYSAIMSALQKAGTDAIVELHKVSAHSNGAGEDAMDSLDCKVVFPSFIIVIYGYYKYYFLWQVSLQAGHCGLSCFLMLGDDRFFCDGWCASREVSIPVLRQLGELMIIWDMLNSLTHTGPLDLARHCSGFLLCTC